MNRIDKEDPDIITIAGKEIHRGETKEVRLAISETYTGNIVNLPILVLRAKQPGAIAFITGAVHGDELNGTGIIHELMYPEPLKLLSGTLLLVPVVNVFGFESGERYMPDRRDLNRSFPGSPSGSLTARFAYTIMQEIVMKCHFGIDLHTAAFQRTNYPNVRADLSDPDLLELAESFCSTLLVDGKGPDGSLRSEACKAGVPTILLEAGEPYKVEPGVLEFGVSGIRNVLILNSMLEGSVEKAPYSAVIHKTTWLRAESAGLLRFHISAGDPVHKNQAVATVYSILGQGQSQILSPVDGIVLGMATMPAVKPGEPVCHIALPTAKIRKLEQQMEDSQEESIHNQIRRDLATNVSLVDAKGRRITDTP